MEERICHMWVSENIVCDYHRCMGWWEIIGKTIAAHSTVLSFWKEQQWFAPSSATYNAH